MDIINKSTNTNSILQIFYNYIISWFYTMNSKTQSANSKSKALKKMNRARLMLCSSASSPYTEFETKYIQRKNFVITDDKRKSRLGKSVSFPSSQGIKRVEDINFCSFIREWYFDE